MSLVQAHNDEKTRALDLLEEIMAALADRTIASPNWGHIGELDAICRDLQDVRDRLTAQGEYAD